MSQKYDQYVNRHALRPPKYLDPNSVKHTTMPPMIFWDGDVPANTHQFLEAMWVFADGAGGVTQGRSTHFHKEFDEVFLFLSSDSTNPDGELGAEIDFTMGEDPDHTELYHFNTSTSVFVPRGVVHLPIYFKQVKRPFLIVTLGINAGSAYNAVRIK